MCDTFVALGNSTADGSVIFGKNSDREPNEAHEVVVIPAADYAPGSMVRCTYMDIPQSAHTYAVLLARPFWTWGAAMGMNEHGLTIGNEAINTKVAQETGKSLTGLDLLRLALERTKTAWEALYKITELLELYGQGGNCGLAKPVYYHNSFLIADRGNAWVLETAGRQWVAQRVKDIRSISNTASIGREWDLSSDNLVRYAIDRGWAKGRDDFHFARCYSDTLYSTLSDARSRQSSITHQLQENRPRINVQAAMGMLRQHNEGILGDSRIDWSILGSTVCMHAGAGPVRNNQTVGSMVAHLTSGRNTAWVTATSAPCTSVFKPIWIDSGFSLDEPPLSANFDDKCLWWRHERLHREILHDYSNRIGEFTAERSALEASFLEMVNRCDPAPESRRKFTQACFKAADQALPAWLDRVCSTPVRNAPAFYYASAWQNYNRQAGLK
jgi:secernin